MTQRYYAITAPGFEKQLADEIDAVGGRKIVKSTGGAEFDATHRTFYRAVYEVRTSNRLYLRVDEFRSRDLPELYRKTRRYQWERLLGGDNKVFIKAVARKSREMHTGKIAESAGHALREHFEKDLGREAPEILDEHEDGAQYLLVRLDDDRCQLSLDASGAHLYKRGWRQDAVEAPIRESLAAALLIRSGWNPRRPLVDPVCGSGTFLVEGAWMAARRPPGDMRGFAFHRWANFRQPLWDDVVAVARKRMREVDEVGFWGYDTDPSAVEAAQANAARAGVEATTDFAQADIAELSAPTDNTGTVIANPPYGERLEEAGGPKQVWERLLDRFAAGFEGWRLGIVLPRGLTPTHERLEFKEEVRFQNGGIAVVFWLGRHR